VSHLDASNCTEHPLPTAPRWQRHRLRSLRPRLAAAAIAVIAAGVVGVAPASGVEQGDAERQWNAYICQEEPEFCLHYP